MSVCPSTTVDPVDTRQQIQNTKLHSHKVLCTRTNTHINQLINKPTKTRTKPSLPKHYSLHETIILLLLLQLNVLRLLKEVLNTFGNFCQSCWLPVAAKHTDHMFFSYIFFFLNNPLGLPGFILLFNMHILRFILFFYYFWRKNAANSLLHFTRRLGPNDPKCWMLLLNWWKLNENRAKRFGVIIIWQLNSVVNHLDKQ